MEVVSQCALRVASLGWRPGHGGFAFTVVCKATFELRPGLSPLAAIQEPVTLADVAAGEGGGLTLASDLVPFKKRPEVLLSGHAHAPDGVPVASLTARLTVGDVDKAIQVTGDRYFGPDGRAGDPAAFARMALVWEHAAGGPRSANPVGRPLGDAAQRDFFGRLQAPNLLPAGLVLTSRSDLVAPVSFGPVAPLWPARAACLQRHAAGWDAARWHEQPLPADIDLAYFNAAPPDQQRTAPFGEEQLFLENLHPRIAHLSTQLAQITPAATADLGAGPQPLQLRCDTLVIDADRGLAMLVWRAPVLLDRPDQPGRVVVTGPSAPRGPARVAWTVDVSSVDPSLAPGSTRTPSAALPFSGSGVTPSSAPSSAIAALMALTSGPPAVTPAAPALERGAIAIMDPSPTAVAERGAMPPASPMTMAVFDQGPDGSRPPSFLFPPVALPFATSPDEGPRRETPSPDSAGGLPFASQPSYPSADSYLSRPSYPSAPSADSYLSPPAYPSTPSADSYLSRPSYPSLDVYPSPPSYPSAASYSPLSYSLPSSPNEPLAAPPLFGAFTPEADAESDTRDTERPPPRAPLFALQNTDSAQSPAPAVAEVPAAEEPLAEAPVPDAPVAPQAIDFDAYPPERCGAIAARLACKDGEAAGTEEILGAEDLDAARWLRVHQHWLDRIDRDTARYQRERLSAYDDAYVSALEAERGPIAADDYARLADAAERNAVASALAERHLPKDAWPRIHRVWIGRMVKDMRASKQVRAAIDALRAAD